MRCTSRLRNARTAIAMARNVLPVPAGPIANTSGLRSIASTNARWPAVRGRISRPRWVATTVFGSACGPPGAGVKISLAASATSSGVTCEPR